MILQPQNNFTVVRQIANHLDAATYYVRAVVRNAYTDETLATLNLDDKGGQRFKKDWQVPADVSGQGFYISIVTSVYSDSGYTAKSENYGDEETTYLVQDRVVVRGGGGGVDAYTIRRIVQEELDKLPKPEPIPVSKEYKMRWDEVLAAIDAKKLDPVDLRPVTSLLKRLEGAIRTHPVTPATDLAPVTDRLDDKVMEIKQVRILLEGLPHTMETAVRNALPEPSEKEEPELIPFDLTKLSL